MGSCRAGGGGGCQSNCLQGSEEKSEVEEAVDADDKSQETVERLSIAGAAESSSDGLEVLCSKCNNEAVAYKNHCAGCFRASLFGKFKLAVTANAMISPTDKILVAVSGGPASRVALQFVHEMQSKAQRIWDASKDQSLPVFGVGVAFIDESVINPTCHKVDKVIEAISSIVSILSPPGKELHIARIESLFSFDLEDGQKKLNNLLNTIADATGKEDILQHMRMLSLQKIALDCGFNKLVLGWCTSGIASHVIAATVKGQGYSLPADIQYVDARWEIPVVLPLRDCLAEELKMLCHLDGLKMQEPLDRPCSGINGLVSSFIARLQEENPSRARTIVRTAEKLSPFSFNKLTENGSHDLLPSRMRRKFQNVKSVERTTSEIMCPICRSPLSDLDMMSLKSMHGKSPGRGDFFAASCCQSCCFQILPKEEASFDHFYSLLPQLMTGRMKDGVFADRSLLREQIKDCLISDDDDKGT